MSKKCWQEQLRNTVRHLQVRSGQPRISVIGIGNELRGDDAAGIVFTHLLKQKVTNPQLQVIVAGVSPENCLGSILDFRPNLILFIDAANMAAKPGTVCWLDWQDVACLNVTTHSLPLNFLARYLTSELGCQVALLGIQPSDTSLKESLTPDVQRIIEDSSQSFLESISFSAGVTLL